MIDRKVLQLMEVYPRYYAELKKANHRLSSAILDSADLEISGIEGLVGAVENERQWNGLFTWAGRVNKLGIEEDEIVRKGHKQRNRRKSFSRIVMPLEYNHFIDIILDARDDPNVRKISIPTESGWVRYKKQDIASDQTVLAAANLASSEGVMTVHFYYKPYKGEGDNKARLHRERYYNTDYEIGFNKYRDKVISTSLSIPGDERDNFRWIGSDKKYFWISGSWSPCNVSSVTRMAGSLKHVYDDLRFAYGRFGS